MRPYQPPCFGTTQFCVGRCSVSTERGRDIDHVPAPTLDAGRGGRSAKPPRASSPPSGSRPGTGATSRISGCWDTDNRQRTYRPPALQMNCFSVRQLRMTSGSHSLANELRSHQLSSTVRATEKKKIRRGGNDCVSRAETQANEVWPCCLPQEG